MVRFFAPLPLFGEVPLAFWTQSKKSVSLPFMEGKTNAKRTWGEDCGDRVR